MNRRDSSKRVAGAVVIMVLLAVLFIGCKKKEEKEPQQSREPVMTVTPEAIETKAPVPEEEAAPTPEPQHVGEARSLLTGEWIPEKQAKCRPFAVMINNIEYAGTRHCGIGQASILYEAIVEGGITRMMGLFENFDADKIGSTRSARHYFVSFASEYDAIFAHFGQTSYALDKIAELGVDNLSGLSALGTTVYYRDNTINPPHNAFTSKKGLVEGAKAAGYRLKYKKGQESHFTFYKENRKLKHGKPAGNIVLSFTAYTAPSFEYHKKDGLYYRSQFGGPHIDTLTGEQLAFKNILVQFVTEWNIDNHGYQTMDLSDTTGTGYYFTNGKGKKITWRKQESTGYMRYLNEDGSELSINPGKTYIAIMPDDGSAKVTISK